VRSDPYPNHDVPSPLADRAILVRNSNRPQILRRCQLFKAKGRMGGICREQLIGPARDRPCSWIERIVGAPETRPRSRLHKRSMSIGSSGSSADSRTNASSFGRRFGSAIICSQRSSCARERRKRANSATAVRFSAESDSQISAISLVSELMRANNHRDSRANAQPFLRFCRP
jgi:hypothetical protein